MSGRLQERAGSNSKVFPHHPDRLVLAAPFAEDVALTGRSTALGIAIVALLGFSLLLNGLFLTTELTLTSRWSTIVLLTVPGLISAFLPRLALLLLIAALPIFGNKPGSAQMIWLTYLSASVFFGAAANVLFTGRAFISELRRSPSMLLGIAGAYLLVSFLSLSSLPLVRFYYELGARHFGGSWTGVSVLLHQFLRFDEDNGVYPVLSVFLTSQGVLFAALLYGLGRAHPRFPIHALGATLAGLTLALVAGLLDYYGLIELRALRKLDPYANPWNAQFRIQSFFGHSGWFAEYVTLAVPSVLTLLALRIRFSLRVAAMITVLLIGEYALILTFQRGGWLSYPLTLVAVWAAIYVGRRLERGERDVRGALRASVLKVAISLPVTILLTGALMFALVRSGILSAEVQTTSEMYVERLKDISRTSDRSKFFIAGGLIGALHPFLGAGSESFGIEFEREFEKPGGRFKDRIVLPLHGTAHNVYAQTFAGKGVLGVVLLVLLAMTAIAHAIREAVAEERSNDERIVLLAGACTGMAFLIYGVVQEVFYIQSLQLLLFSSIGITAAVLGRTSVLSAPSSRRIALVTLFFLVGHLTWELAVPGRAAAELARPEEFGCYRRERDAGGSLYRWCASRAGVRVPVVEGPDGIALRFAIRADQMSGGREHAQLKVFAEGKEIFTSSVARDQLQQVAIPITDGVRAALGGSILQAGEQVPVTIELDSRFVPHFAMNRRGDYRLLSFRFFPDAGIAPNSVPSK